MKQELWISIGEVAARTGIATSALRYYEAKGFIKSMRTAGKQRQFHRETLRRIAFIRVAQGVGLTLEEIGAALATLMVPFLLAAVLFSYFGLQRRAWQQGGDK